MLAGVDAAQAISDLTEISPQVRHVAVIEADGSVTGSNLSDATAAERLATGAKRLVEEAQTLRSDVAQLEAATLNGSVFVVRDGERLIAATTTPEPTVGLVFYDLKTCLRSRRRAQEAGAAQARPEEDDRTMPPRKLVTGMMLAAGSLAGSVLVRRRAARKRERVDLYAEDGSMHSFSEGSPEALRLLPIAHDSRCAREPRASSAQRCARPPTSKVTSCSAPGRRSKYYLDKYRFETRPDLLGPLGEAIAAAVAEHEPAAVRLAGPELGAVALAAAASLAGGLPFLIVRKEAKGYGTSNQLEGVYAEGECVCLVEDVVTSGGAAIEAVEALAQRPDCGSRTRSASSTARRAASTSSPATRCACGPLFTASELLEMPANPLG